MNIAIQGVSLVFHGGADLQSLENIISLRSKVSEFEIKEEIFQSNPSLSKMRRAGKFAKLALMGAENCILDSGISPCGNESMGLIIATGLGAHVETFEYIDSLLDFGEKNPSPIKFTHSLHNCAATYISTKLKINGPCITIADFYHSFENALLTADTWLNLGVCKYVLLGALDECGSVLSYVFDNLANKGKEVFDCKKAGEGAVFFMLEKRNDSKYCFIENGSSIEKNNVNCFNLYISKTFSGNKEAETKEQKNTIVSSIFGENMINDAFAALISVLILEKERNFNFNGFNIIPDVKEVRIHNSYDKSNSKIRLFKSGE
ncbi:MAG: beta-ketoacyl synthase [uncultured bacterium]|nr:MAG: beta-ketoacyl synthase [uncultured bacterium]